MKILVAEDDRLTRQGLAEVLEAEGYQVHQAADGAEALALYDRVAPDLVCLDIMMPVVDGYEVCRRLRARSMTVPVIFISAKSEEIDTVVGLELGADDFLTKPFGIREVVARIRAVTRRCRAAQVSADPAAAAAPFRMGDLEVLPDELRARRGGEVVDLSLREVAILRLLHDRAGKAVDRNTIFNVCWGVDYLPSSRTLDQTISQLRKRIERDPGSPLIITTVHGVGYRYQPDDREAGSH
ncbi:MAG TPA: response regulator transcription factor [Methylomirabilota bacterium]|nr:response regulator transcription factor [Methylomirabilota bacterium]